MWWKKITTSSDQPEAAGGESGRIPTTPRPLGATACLVFATMMAASLHTLIITRPFAQRGLAVRYLKLRKKAQE
ncbi:MAG: hypothetical protein CL922_01885 [Deltaproteobacteria bacterium]|nr:hypothetical protein [Deltaproteobacteria bacterium]